MTKVICCDKITLVFKRHAQIAQLVEQWTENPRVTGSIPVLGTFFMPKNSIKRLWRVGCLHTKAHRHLMRSTHEQRRRQPICECCCDCESANARSNLFLEKTMKFKDGSSWFLLSSFFLAILKGSDLLLGRKAVRK